MEIRQYLLLFRKWAWLLALGGVLGGGVAYIYSMRQPLVFQTTSKMMVQSPIDTQSSYYYSYYDDIQRVKNYTQLITTEPILTALSERLGFKVSKGISVKQVQDAQIIEITVSNSDPRRAALIANGLVEEFITYYTNLQIQRFSESEQSLQAQIKQVEGQIKALQSEMTSLTQKTLETQIAETQKSITELEEQIKPIEEEIELINAALAPYTATATPSPTRAAAAGTRATETATLTPEPTATYTTEQVDYIKEKSDLLRQRQNELSTLQAQLELYRQVYVNLTVYGQTGENTSNASSQSQAQATLALYQQIYSNLLNNYENVRLSRLRSTPSIIQIEVAQVPRSQIQPRPVRNAGLGVVVGVLILGLAVFLIEYLDDTIKTPEEINTTLGLPVIGMIGEMEKEPKGEKRNGVYVDENPRSPIAEAFRTLRTNLEFAGVDKPIKALLVSSAEPSEGKTTIAVNLAASLAQGEKKVILVDADMRRPSIHRMLNVPNRSGLTDVFRHPEELQASIYEWDVMPLKIIPSGALPPNPAELLGSESMDRILSELKDVSDMVIIDGPPFIVADPVVLSSKVDGVLIVIEPGGTHIEAAKAMVEQLKRAEARVIGVVLNPIRRNQASYYTGRYRYYSKYYSTKEYGYYSHGNGSKFPKNGKNGAKRIGQLPEVNVFRSKSK